MKRVKLTELAPPTYWEHAEKQGLSNNMVDVSDWIFHWLIANKYATFVKDLPKKTGKNKPLVFGDRVTYKNRYAIFVFHYQDEMKGACRLLFKNRWNQEDVCTNDLKRGWKHGTK